MSEELRKVALEHAVYRSPEHAQTEQVVAQAERFYAFLTKDEPPYQCCTTVPIGLNFYPSATPGVVNG